MRKVRRRPRAQMRVKHLYRIIKFRGERNNFMFSARNLHRSLCHVFELSLEGWEVVEQQRTPSSCCWSMQMPVSLIDWCRPQKHENVSSRDTSILFDLISFLVSYIRLLCREIGNCYCHGRFTSLNRIFHSECLLKTNIWKKLISLLVESLYKPSLVGVNSNVNSDTQTALCGKITLLHNSTAKKLQCSFIYSL